MASPFPGMDPYLEISGDWRDFQRTRFVYRRRRREFRHVRWQHLVPAQALPHRQLSYWRRRSGDRLDADKHPHKRALPAAARPEQPGDRAAGQVKGEVIEHQLPASADDRGKETLIDRMNHRQQMLQAQLQALQQTEPAVQALYEKLTPEQKAIVDHPFRRG